MDELLHAERYWIAAVQSSRRGFLSEEMVPIAFKQSFVASTWFFTSISAKFTAMSLAALSSTRQTLLAALVR